MKQLRLIYGVNPFHPPRISTPWLAMSDASVYLMGCNGELKILSKHDDTDTSDRSTSWKNTCLTNARKSAEHLSKFYGIKPERMENKKVVPRSFNYSVLINETFGKTK